MRIVSVTPDTGPRRLVLVLDASGSMGADRTKWDIVLFAATDFVSQQPEQNFVALLVFASQVTKKVLFTGSRKEVLETLVDLKDWKQIAPKAERKTALWDTLQAASDMLDPPQTGDVVYAITDGGDNLSHPHSREKVERTFRVKGIRLFASMPMNSWEDKYLFVDTRFLELTKETGGNVATLGSPQHFPTPSELGSILLPFYQQMNEIYRIQVQLSQAPDKFRSWTLEFAKPQSPKAKNTVINYPQQLAPCTQ